MRNPFDPGYFGSEELRGFGFGRVGENVQIAKNCTIIGLPNISIGDNVRIDANTHIIAASGKVVLGSYIHIGGTCHLAARGGITMADFSGLSQGVRIYSASDDYSGRYLTNPTVPTEFTGCTVAPVDLGRHVILGSGCVVLPGCTIGEGASVGALSLVTKSLDPWGVYFGSPVRRMKSRSRQLLDVEAEFLAREPRLQLAR